MRRLPPLVPPLLLLLAGCVDAPADGGFSDVAKEVADRAGVDLEWQRDDDARRRADERVHALLANELDVDAAVQVALLRSAGLQATLEELGLARADLLEAGLIANPILEAELRFPSHPSSPLEIHVLQDFLTALTMPMRKRVAAAELERTKLAVTQETLHRVADVKGAWFEALAAGERLALRRTDARAAEAGAEMAQRLFDAGNFTELERDAELALDGRARLELSLAESESLGRRSALESALGLWGEEAAAIKLPARVPEPPDRELAADRAESTAIARRLDLAAARAEVDARAQAAGLVHDTGWLDSLEVGIHWEREPDGTNTVGPSVAIPLPFFSRGPSANERAYAMLRQSLQRYRALAVDVRAQARALAGRLLGARRRSEYLRDVFVPLRTRIVAQSQLQYDAMQIGVFDLLRARQEESDASVQAVDARRDYWVARAELEQAVGGTLVAVNEEKP